MRNPATKEVVYPDSDGKPMADNTRQFRYIVMIEGGLEYLFRNDPNVFVAGDLLWYPVEGSPRINAAPDALVVFGRPKGDRGSYVQHREDDIPPHVVFEVLSPNNRPAEMRDKLAFYERHGVEEYYVYDPDNGTLEGHARHGARLEQIDEMQGHVSARLGVRFELDGLDLNIYDPDGRPFSTYVEVAEQLDRAEELAERQRQRAEQERKRAEQEHKRAEREKAKRERIASEKAEQTMAREKAEKKAEKLAEKLRELGVDPDSLT